MVEYKKLGGRCRPKFTGELLQEAVTLYEAGYSTIDVARMLSEHGYNITPQAVWQNLRKLGKVRDRKLAQRIRRAKERRLGI